MDIVKYLCNTTTIHKPLHLLNVSCRGGIQTFNYLLHRYPIVPNTTTLKIASKTGHPEIIQTILYCIPQQQITKEIYNKSIMSCIVNKNVSIFQILLIHPKTEMYSIPRNCISNIVNNVSFIKLYKLSKQETFDNIRSFTSQTIKYVEQYYSQELFDAALNVNNIGVANVLAKCLNITKISNTVILKCESYKSLKFILQFECDPSTGDNRLLRNAIKYRSVTITNLLLQDPRIKITADLMELAIKYDFPELITTLLQTFNYDLWELFKSNIKNSTYRKMFYRQGFECAENNWALNFAVSQQNMPLLEWLLSFDTVDPNFNKYYILRKAIISKDTYVVQAILKKTIVQPNSQWSLFKYALLHSTFAIIKLLHYPGFECADNNFAIQQAVAKENTPLTKWLLSFPTVDPAVNNQSLLHVAITNKSVDIVRALVSSPQIDPTANDYCALKIAAGKFPTPELQPDWWHTFKPNPLIEKILLQACINKFDPTDLDTFILFQ